MRWWRLALGGALLAWVLGTAYRQAKRRDRKLGAAVVLVGLAALMFAIAALAPRPPVTIPLAAGLVVGSIALLALAMGIVLWMGFSK